MFPMCSSATEFSGFSARLHQVAYQAAESRFVSSLELNKFWAYVGEAWKLKKLSKIEMKDKQGNMTPNCFPIKKATFTEY